MSRGLTLMELLVGIEIIANLTALLLGPYVGGLVVHFASPSFFSTSPKRLSERKPSKPGSRLITKDS